MDCDFPSLRTRASVVVTNLESECCPQTLFDRVDIWFPCTFVSVDLVYVLRLEFRRSVSWICKVEVDHRELHKASFTITRP